MKLTVVGCWGGYPKKNEASSGYLLEHDGFRVLIDCGSAVISKLQNYVQPEELDALILSHYHADHIADVGILQHARLIQGFLGKTISTLPIYGHSLNQREFEQLTYKNITTGFEYNPDQLLELGPFKVQFLLTKHPVPCYAMRFEVAGKSFVYTADTSFKEEFVPFSANADLLLSECNLYRDQDGSGPGHMNSTDAGNLAEQAKVKHLVLTHLPHFGELNKLKEEAAHIYAGPIDLAQEGQVFTI